MFVKKFEAPTIEDALSAVKAQLGAEALVLSTRKVKHSLFQKPFYEVTAAYEPASEEDSESLSDEELADIFPHRKEGNKYFDDESSIRKTDYARYTEMLPQSASGIIREPYKELLRKLGLSESATREMNNRLVSDYSSKDLAHRPFRNKVIRQFLGDGIHILRPEFLMTRNGWVIRGASGSGKTSVALKLAMFLKRRGHNVSLACGERRKLLGPMELATYGKLIDVPFDAEPRIRLRQDCIQLVDGQGSEDERLVGFGEIVVLDANLRIAEMERSIGESSRLEAVVFTRLDACEQKAAILEFLKTSGVALLGASVSASLDTPFRFFQSTELVRYVVQGKGVL